MFMCTATDGNACGSRKSSRNRLRQGRRPRPRASPAGIATAAFAAVDRELEEAARNLGASAFEAFRTVTLPLALPGILASAIFVFLISLDEFTGTFFVGVPDITTMPLLLFTASMEGNYQIASITALILLVPSVAFMLVIEKFLRADVLAKVGT